MSPSSDKDWQAQSDAKTLQSAAEIHGDPKRHKAAHEHLGKMASAMKSAHKNSAKQLHKTVKKGLAKTFSKATPEE